MSPETGDSQRVFFAVWPPAWVADALAVARDAALAQVGGRAMPTGSLHCTLSFLGRLDADQLDAVLACASRVTHPGFQLEIAGLNYWPHNRIVWAGLGDPAAGLASLSARLCEVLEGIVEAPALTVPHITLLRGAKAAAAATLERPLRWQCDEFVLARAAKEASGARYELIARWPLAGGGEKASIRRRDSH